MKDSVFSAVIWGILERFSTQIISFLIGIILARLLSPHDYGVVGIITIFIAFSNVFIDAGFSNAIIRKLNCTESDYSTAFFSNIAIGFLVYSILWLSAPIIAFFFKEKILETLIKVAGLNVIFNSLCIVQNAILTSKLNIRLQTLINIGGQLPAGLIAIILAYHGFGIYALVIQTIGASFIKTVLLWTFAGWRPLSKFSRDSFTYLWNFGSRLLFANLIGVIFNEINSILIGKFISKDALGYYSKASQLNTNVSGVSTGVVQKIALPLLSKYQNDIPTLRLKFREMMSLLLMVLAPITAFLCFSSKDLICVLWTSRWIESADIFSLLILGSIFSPISSLSLTLLQVVGKSSTILKLEAPKKAIYIILIFCGFYYGVIGLAISSVFINFVAAVVNMFPTKSIISYSYKDQFSDLARYVLFAFPLGYSLHILTSIQNIYLSIISYAFLFFSSYILLLFLFGDQNFKKQVKHIQKFVGND